ncbi:helix-turn-helix transcriptional regulator [Ensifer adhaerens]|uniref:helix-turn-helix transcriptional regulator n=1 Tax=Ensifer adhaerens TaxID=106592 RepID=UPI001C4E05B5|nr:helix-turn-helix transcriptional regulator [Ensifer adhaerens]MBW0366700.1 helix-turn-helix transcriptional regulator [Ensifer adhaerens]UCM18357.1 helix-turn-helix transcriptional regulator [Ensifer adhaerens]
MLAVARLILGQTQAEVAEDSGISPRTIYMIEKGSAGIASVEKLVRHYGKRGIVFLAPSATEGWGIRANFVGGSYDDERPE